MQLIAINRKGETMKLVEIQEGVYEERESYWFEVNKDLDENQIVTLIKKAKKLSKQYWDNWTNALKEICRKHNRYDLVESGWISATYSKHYNENKQLNLSEDLYRDLTEAHAKHWTRDHYDWRTFLVELSNGKLKPFEADIYIDIEDFKNP